MELGNNERVSLQLLASLPLFPASLWNGTVSSRTSRTAKLQVFLVMGEFEIRLKPSRIRKGSRCLVTHAFST